MRGAAGRPRTGRAPRCHRPRFSAGARPSAAVSLAGASIAPASMICHPGGGLPPVAPPPCETASARPRAMVLPSREARPPLGLPMSGGCRVGGVQRGAGWRGGRLPVSKISYPARRCGGLRSGAPMCGGIGRATGARLCDCSKPARPRGPFSARAWSRRAWGKPRKGSANCDEPAGRACRAGGGKRASDLAEWRRAQRAPRARPCLGRDAWEGQTCPVSRAWWAGAKSRA